MSTEGKVNSKVPASTIPSSQRGMMLVNPGQVAPRPPVPGSSPFQNGLFLVNPGQPASGSSTSNDK